MTRVRREIESTIHDEMSNEPNDQTELAVSDGANEMTTVVSYQQQTDSDEQDDGEHHDDDDDDDDQDDDDEYAPCNYFEFSSFFYLYFQISVLLNLIEKLNLLHSTDKPHKKPQNHNENQIIVETNPVNNIHVEAPMITTIIGHPIVEQVPGLIEFFFFCRK